MADGVRLAADLYRPADAQPGERFPVLLEYLPYRKAESRGRRYSLYSYFVERGYIVALVDIRGTGNSEGRLVDREYSEQEQSDGEEVIAWLARQPFSTGNVGMFGVSWGGFNSIHLALREPPALKAIVAIEATDDLFEDDVHFIDGILHFSSYELGQDVRNAVPGAPSYTVDDDFLADRFDTPPWMLQYKRQQRDGAFWDRGSLNVDYSRLRVPAYVIGGWYDGYRDSVPRMLENVSAPIKGLIGPWGHTFPNWGYPEPRIEWRREAVRWFDQWLRGVDNGVLDEPAFAVYVRDAHPPGVLERAPGQWRWEEGWPLERGQELELHAHPDHSLAAVPAEPAVHRLQSRPSDGIEAAGSAFWWGDFAPDQRKLDERSLVYDSAPLEAATEVLGFPRVHLDAKADVPLAHWFVRLSDVAPDGQVTLITGAALNGAHRNGTSVPQPLVPGETSSLEIELHFTSWVFSPGHRIRMSISNAQWPMFWPTPDAVSTELILGGDGQSRLVLPVVPEEPRPRPDFEAPEDLDPTMPAFASPESLGPTSPVFPVVERDPATGDAVLTVSSGSGTDYPWGRVERRERMVHRTNDVDPAHSSFSGRYAVTVLLGERRLQVEGSVEFASSRDDFRLVFTRRLEENGQLVSERSWNETFARDFQ